MNSSLRAPVLRIACMMLRVLSWRTHAGAGAVRGNGGDHGTGR
jgi:hypothetical protein